MATTTDTIAPGANLELVVTRLLDAPRELVFKAWTRPEHAAQWWGPQGFTTESCRLDARPGGTFRIVTRAPDGGIYTKCGVYREVVPPERLVFSFAWEDANGDLGPELQVTVRLEAEGARTRLTLHQSGFESVARRDDHRTGWTSCLQRFADWLAATGDLS